MKVEYFERRSAREPLERLMRPRDGAWAHISGHSIRFDDISELFSLDSNTIRDVADMSELARAEYITGAEYVFLRLPVGASDAGVTAPLLCIVQSSRLITINVHGTFSPIAVDEYITTSTDRPSSLLVAVIAWTIVEYERRLRDLAAKIGSARKRLNQHEVENADFIDFVAIEDSLSEYRSSLDGVGSVVRQLSANRRGIFRARDIEALEDLSLHIQQLLVAIASNTQTIASIQNAYSTIANNTLNQRMKLLTAITILLAIPNVFYGMYGMNITLPFQHEWWAYPAIVSFTLLLILLVYAIAKRFRLF